MEEAEIPPYLRFDYAKLNYSYMDSRGGKNTERFAWVQMILQPFKEALIGSKFEFLGKISHWKSFFNDSSTFLDHIDKLLQIFARCRVYKFNIESDINPTNVFPALLQFDAIIRCSKIRFKFNYFGGPMQTRLPIEAIGNWLNRTNADGPDGQEHIERFMKLQIRYDVPNLGEIFGHLKKVYHSFF